jgi:hypothetical protein
MSDAIHPDRPDRIAALRAEAAAVLTLVRSLSDDEWHTPSAAAGWRVQEVVAHMAAACHGMFSPAWAARVLSASQVERANDDDAEARRDWPPSRVLAEYERWSPWFVRMQAVMARVPGAHLLRVPLGELGRFPVPLLASAFVFDHWTHLAHDIAPVLDRPAPVTDANRMAVVVEWMLAGLEQMCRARMTWLDQPVGLALDGPGGGSWLVTPAGDGRLRVSPGDVGSAPASITARVHEFPVWGTTRRGWRDCDVVTSGDDELASRFLDSIDVI